MSESPTAPQRTPARHPLVTVVEEATRLAPHMIRVVVGGDDLEGFAAGRFTDHYVKLQIPPPGAGYAAPFDVAEIRATRPREEWARTRTFTVRAFDPDRRRLTLDFVDHGDTGVAGPWAAAARPGDRLQLMGPGGAYAPDPAADWHLMVGDASVLPAIGASLERVPEGAPVHVLVEVDAAGDELPLASPGDLRLSWLRTDPAARDSGPLIDALRTMAFPEGQLHAFVHGEASMVRAVRRHLLVDRGVPSEAVSASGYWKRSRTEEGWRDDKAEWKRLAEQDVVEPAS